MMELEEALDVALRRQQLLAERKAEADTMPADQLKDTMLRALLYDLEQTNKVLKSAGNEGMPGSLEVPLFHEWVMLIQQNAVQASQLVIALNARNKQQGSLAEPSLQISIEAFERAQRLFATATTDPEQAERISRSARIGRAVLEPCPEHEDWVRLINQEPSFAQSVYAALQTKRAMFGLQTPQTVVTSIAAYEAATEEQQ